MRMKWHRRRFLWRASLFYNSVSFILVIAIGLTFALHYLLTKFSFFVNYNCSARSIKHITLYVVLQMVLIGTILLITILLGRLCNLFSNYSLEDCKYSKRMIDILGFTLKWLPSVAGLLMATLFTLQFTCLLWTQINTRQWCVNRFNESAVNAVRNCRMIHQGGAACKLNFKITTKKEIRNCNSVEYLKKKRIIYLSLADAAEGCTIEDISVCNAMDNVFNEKEVNWHSKELKGCLGRIPRDDEPLFDDLNPSDLYRYVISMLNYLTIRYLFLANISGTLVSILIIIAFFVVRFVTVFDAIIYQPTNENDNACIKFMRPMTMWS